MRTLEEAVFWEIYTCQSCVRRDLAKRLGTSWASVSRSVDALLSGHLVVETTSAKTMRGRRPHVLQVNPQLATLLGLEIDRSVVTAVLTDMVGTLLGRGTVNFDASQGVQAVIEPARTAIRNALADAEVPQKEVKHLGVGHPGVLELKSGRCEFWYNVPAWRNVPLKQFLQDALGLPVTLDDRSRAIALAERRASPEDGKHPNALYINSGIGVGTGIFINGHLYHGSAQCGGEIGHLTVDKNGPQCSCGKQGCVQAYAGTRELIARVKNTLRSGAFSLLRDTYRDDLDAITVEMIAAAAARGDRIATQALREAAEALGTGIAAAVQILNPSLVVLTGKLFQAAGPIILPTINEVVRQDCFEIFLRRLRIRLSTVKKDLSAIGCALLGATCVATGALHQKLSVGPSARAI